MAGRTGPTGFRPKLRSVDSLQSNPGKSPSLIVSVFRGARKIALQQLHHPGAALRTYGPATSDLCQQTRSGVSRELVPVLAVWPPRDSFAAIGIFAKSLLIHVDVREAQRGVIPVHRVAFVLP